MKIFTKNFTFFQTFIIFTKINILEKFYVVL